jgi:hypothetical protein
MQALMYFCLNMFYWQFHKNSEWRVKSILFNFLWLHSTENFVKEQEGQQWQLPQAKLPEEGQVEMAV